MNLSTLIIATIIAIPFFTIVVISIKKKKKGCDSCSCGSCGMKDTCNH